MPAPSQAAQSATTNSNSPGTESRVHSAGCVKDGKAICVCDKPAKRLISKPFYSCATNTCKFWRWESDLIAAGLVPPLGAAPPTTPETSQSQLLLSYFLSPPQTQLQAKRTFTHLSPYSNSVSTPSCNPQAGPGPGPIPRASELLSEEARKRRMANILAGLKEVKDEEGDAFFLVPWDVWPPRPTPAMSSSGSGNSQSCAIDLGSDLEDQDQDEEEEEYILVKNKRARFATDPVDTEGEGGTNSTQSQTYSQVQMQMPSTPPRRSTFSQSVQLPTPSHTSEREAHMTDVDSDDDDIPASPTSFTKASQRARAKAKARARTNKDDGLSFSKRRANVRAVKTGQRSDASTLAAASQESSSEREGYEIDPLDADTQAALLTVQAGLHKVLAGKYTWQRKAIAAERLVVKLREENKELKARLSELVRLDESLL